MQRTGCAKLKSRDQMNKGVQAYKNNHYAEAVKHFKEAVRLDPTNAECAAVSGDVVHDSVGAGRRISRQQEELRHGAQGIR